ncbi:protein of unknown function [Thermococcus camini]|uniref:Uncharacterized protein n=1 Tax=Thermococcus camini TaxID=2016373 RepID=A0A7G2DDY9_9EURY|nr:protein of unknown function [Thermococcus camini]
MGIKDGLRIVREFFNVQREVFLVTEGETVGG